MGLTDREKEALVAAMRDRREPAPEETTVGGLSEAERGWLLRRAAELVAASGDAEAQTVAERLAELRS